MRGANPERGEVALKLGAGERVLRPTFAALVAAEAELGSLFRLLERAGAGELRLADMAPLLWHCRVPMADEDRAAFEAELLTVGLAALAGPFRALLQAVFGGR